MKHSAMFGLGIATAAFVLMSFATGLISPSATGHSGELDQSIFLLVPLCAALIGSLCFLGGTKSFQFRRSNASAFGSGVACGALQFVLLFIHPISIVLFPFACFLAPSFGGPNG